MTPFMNAEQSQLAEQRQFLMTQATNQINDARQSEKELDLTKAEALKNAQDRGATAMQIAKIQDAKSIPELAATGFMTSAMEQAQLYGQRLSNQLDEAKLAGGDGTLSPSDRKTLFELAEKGETGAIQMLGYDPRELPANKQAEFKALEDVHFKTQQGMEAVADILEKTSSLSGVTTATDGVFGAISRFSSAILPTQDLNFKDGKLTVDMGGFTGQSDILSDLKYITANLTIDELGKMEVPLTPLSDADMRKVGEAASRINGMLITKGDDQQIVGIRGSESKVREELNTIYESLGRVQDEINAKMLSAEDLIYIYQ
jgi:hypothetical protein